MKKYLGLLKLDTLNICSKKVWLSFFGLLFIMMLNYRALVMPMWLLFAIMFIIVCYSLASLFGYIYWLIDLWNYIELEIRLLRFSYWVVLGLINLMNIYLLLSLI